jgi:tungstate transport system substrate-binding protein
LLTGLRRLPDLGLIYYGKAGFGQIFRSFLLNSYGYSPQTIEKSASNCLSLATIAKIRQPPKITMKTTLSHSMLQSFAFRTYYSGIGDLLMYYTARFLWNGNGICHLATHRLLVLLLTGFFGMGSVQADNILRLATTTSTDNSGLLQVLVPPFEKQNNMRVHVIAVGTGKALRLAREGDVDIVLVHAREAEDKLVADGYGVNRRDVMYNDFVIVGPHDDPAGIRDMKVASAAMARIANSGNVFVSRGDNSGTHKKEIILWKGSGIQPGGSWYREAGQGMGKVLQIAGEMQAYTLTDRGTWLAYQQRLPLEILSEGDSSLHNPYGIIAVNPDRYSGVNYDGAMKFIDWITSDEGQQLIRDFKISGKALFLPSATLSN